MPPKLAKNLNNVYKDSAPSHRTVAKWVAEFNNSEHGFEDAPRMSCPSTITTAENIEAEERLAMRDRQVSIHLLAEEWPIIHEDHEQSQGHEEGLHTVLTEIFHTNSSCQSCGLLSRAPATQRSKSGQVF